MPDLYTEAVRHFTRQLNNPDVAADLVQESYVRILSLAPGTEIENIRALLFQTVRNLAVDHVRKQQAETRMLQTLSMITAGHSPSAEHVASARQQLQHLLARLEAMPGRRRDTFVLVRIYGYSHAEAAKYLRTSTSAIEKNVVRAICDLMAWHAAQ